jgi:hypothetical protein
MTRYTRGKFHDIRQATQFPIVHQGWFGSANYGIEDSLRHQSVDLRRQIRQVVQVQSSTACDGMSVTQYYDDPPEEFEVAGLLVRSGGSKPIWKARAAWKTMRGLR